MAACVLLIAGLGTACSASSQGDGDHAASGNPSAQSGGLSQSAGSSASAPSVTAPPLVSGGDTQLQSQSPQSPTQPSTQPSTQPPAQTSHETTPQPPAATVTATPAFGATDIAPAATITLRSHGGTLAWVTMVNPDGEQVKGAVSDDRTGWTLGEPLGYGRTYTVTGVAVNAIGVQTPIDGTFTTATTKQPITTSISPGDGALVGVATPVIVRFGIRPEDKALIEKHVTITTEPEVEGAWAWVQHTDAPYPALDWRPKEFWPAGTKVHVESNIYGLKFQDGWYGGDSVSVDFTIGRNQVVKADAKTQKVTVLRDGKKVKSFYGSFGRGDRVGDPNLVTRSGIHVVTSKHKVYKMSNPDYGYEDVKEYWAVRISNNGEFLHNNPGTGAWALKNSNITHGCVNLSWDDAKWYFESALYGDPVIVTGTSIELSRSDGDIYDWTIPWDKWLTMSALSGDSAANPANPKSSAVAS